MPLSSGTSLGRYEIRSLLGAGGMGEVYLAHDAQLDRTVALKILHSDVASDTQRMRRFVQEAKAASSLNHPNILTIYEIGEADSQQFIVTEFIDGETLRARMTRARLKLTEALDVSIQVANALSAAHAAAIVHRDIKPENVMVRGDGYVKVLDFGLAKLTEHDSGDSEATTMVNTDPGVIMGTVSYMSPEQARGLAVDARTDIWSLGVVLYEMVAGCVPFAGATPTDAIISIAEREPAQLSRHVAEVPVQLERIVRKALAKEREERYQTVKDLALDLKGLRRELDIEGELERTVPPELRGRTSETSVRRADAETVNEPAAVPTSSAAYIAGEIKRHKLGVGMILVTLLAAIVAVAYFAYFLRGDKEAITSIAVLPFVNASNDPNNEYLSDGITENIIYRLSQLPELRVIPRNSVFRYKGRDAEVADVGRELQVRAVLTGRVSQLGDQLVISTEMVDTVDNRLLWGQQYKRKLSDLLTVQEEISREISEKLRLKLSGNERTRLAKRYTDNTEAFKLYTQGRYHWNKRTPEDIRRAIEYFGRAIDVDPNYALAYAGLADCYGLLSEYGAMAPMEAAQKTKAAAMKAMEIDGTLAEASTALAYVKEYYDWDSVGAESEFKRAIELNPNYATAHQWYSEYLSNMGRHQEALAEAQQAQELDPLSLIINHSLGGRFYLARKYDDAIRQFLKTLELDRNFPHTHYRLGLTYMLKEMHTEAITEMEKTVEISGRNSIYVAALAFVFGISGNETKALNLINELIERSRREYVSSYFMALAYTGIGKKDEAFAWLEKAYQEHDFLLRLLKVEPCWDRLRSDPRYQDLVRRVGLPV